MPVSRATISAACFRGTPAATSSATAASASASAAGSATTAPGPSTSVISPFGGSANRSASSAAVPRATSSNRFVSSRQTAAARAGSAAASERSVVGSRCGDSNATAGHGHVAQLLPQLGERLLAAREEAEELVLLADEPRRDERRLDRRRPRQHRHGHARVERRAHDPRARVGDARQPRVGDERDPLPRLEPRQQLGRPRRLVVLVVREQPRLDAVPLEQAARVPRVLAEHDVGGAQLREHAQRHVLEVADRRGADGERHHTTAR